MPVRASPKRPRIGLALGSGAARGWSQIGIIEALLQAGIVPEIVCATSIGSVVGAAYVTGRLPELTAFALALSRREMVALLDVRLNAGGLIDGKRIMTALAKLGIDGDIGALEKPFAAVATDLETGREIWLRSGALLDAVRASIALPGVLGPHMVDGRWLGDGGLVNPVPVSVCRALGADVIIAVNLNGDIVAPFEPGFFRRMTAPDPDGQFVRQLTERLPAPIARRPRRSYRSSSRREAARRGISKC
jgi:NTE family protein